MKKYDSRNKKKEWITWKQPASSRTLNAKRYWALSMGTGIEQALIFCLRRLGPPIGSQSRAPRSILSP